jgi:hypothetical protein
LNRPRETAGSGQWVPLADVGGSVDHPPALAWLREEPGREIADSGHCNRHPKVSRSATLYRFAMN